MKTVMRAKLALGVCVLMGVFFTLSSCHTSPLQPAAGMLQNTWTMMPVEAGNEYKWVFNNGQLSILHNGTPVEFTTEDGTVKTFTNYGIENDISNHYVYIDPMTMKDSPKQFLPGDVKKFLVIKLTDDELYLESITEEGYKGGKQYHFYSSK